MASKVFEDVQQFEEKYREHIALLAIIAMIVYLVISR
jgi:hypothetical protein